MGSHHCYMAARDLGITYPYCEYEGDDPLGFVISRNLKRRHLTESQRAMIAAAIAKLPRGRPATPETRMPTSEENARTETRSGALMHFSEKALPEQHGKTRGGMRGENAPSPEDADNTAQAVFYPPTQQRAADAFGMPRNKAKHARELLCEVVLEGASAKLCAGRRAESPPTRGQARFRLIRLSPVAIPVWNIRSRLYLRFSWRPRPDSCG